MEPTLIECPACHRHARADEPACPFCASALAKGAPSPRGSAPVRVAVAAAVMVVASAGLAACYGGPPRPAPYRPPTSTGDQTTQGTTQQQPAQTPSETAPAQQQQQQ